ncbi:hypothetical protein BDW75DRAFT_200445 [Aspergillus navahoensis]
MLNRPFCCPRRSPTLILRGLVLPNSILLLLVTQAHPPSRSLRNLQLRFVITRLVAAAAHAATSLSYSACLNGILNRNQEELWVKLITPEYFGHADECYRP